jgi:hypothetical protein
VLEASGRHVHWALVTLVARIASRLFRVREGKICRPDLEKHLQHDARDSLLRLRVTREIVSIVAEGAVDAETLLEHIHPALQLLLCLHKGKYLKISPPRWFRFLLRVYVIVY